MALIPNTPEIPLIGLIPSLAPPNWKDKYRPGSFRGVEFKTKSHKFDSGRHDVEHEFPSKEDGNSEDLGKRLPKFNLELYVLGDDYFDQRDKLMAALDQEGDGELIHPYLGKKQVQVGKYTVTETVEEGRIARFSVEFTNAGTVKFPAEATDAVQSVFDAINSVLNGATAALATGLSVVGAPARVAQAAAKLVQDGAARINQVAKIAGSSAQGVADVAFAIRNITAEAQDLVQAPDKLAQRFKDAFALLFTAVEDAKTLSKTLSSEVSSFAPEPIVGSDTPTVQKLKGNQVAFTNFLVNVSISQQAQAAITGNYFSVDESVNIRDLLNQDIENQLPNIDDDDSYQAIKDLQVGINLGLPPQNVGEILTFTPAKTLPVLVIAQKLFGAIDKEDEIISQNAIRHPGFVPGGIEIEVSESG